MTSNYRFKFYDYDGKQRIFEQNNLLRFAKQFPNRNASVYDTTTNKPVGRMKLGSALEKFG